MREFRQELMSYQTDMDRKGWALYPNVLDPKMVAELSTAMDHAYTTRREIQVKNGIEANMDGTLHHLVDAPVFLELLERMYLHQDIEDYFKGKYLLNSFGGVINMKDKASYVCNIHRDVRTYTGKVVQMLNMLIAIDDFTLENGATWLLSGSHRKPERPTDEEFFEQAERAVMPAGSVVLFDANVWHAAGENQTDQARRAITITWTKPYIKQQLDYPRFIGYNKIDSLSDDMKQVLGYNARIPESLDEWYQPVEKRMYKKDQG